MPALANPYLTSGFQWTQTPAQNYWKGASLLAPQYGPAGTTGAQSTNPITGYQPTNTSTYGNAFGNAGSLNEVTGQPKVGPVNVNPLSPGANPNDPNSYFSLLDQTKNPQVAANTNQLLTDQSSITGKTVQGFDNYLAQETAALQAAGQQQTEDTKTLAAIPAGYQTAATAATAGLSAAQQQEQGQYATANQNNAQTVQQEIAQLASLNTQEQSNVQNVAALADAAAQAQNSKFQLRPGGVPTANSGENETLAANTFSNINVPLQEALSQQQMAQEQNFIAPQEQALYAGQIGNIQFNANQASQLAQFGISNAAQVAQIQQAVTGKSFQEGLQYLQSLGIPLSVAQNVLSGSVSQLGSLSGTNNNNTFYGLAAPYGTPGLTSPSGYSFQTPQAPQLSSPYGRIQPGNTGGGSTYNFNGYGQPTNNGQVVVPPAGAPQYPPVTQNPYQNGTWYDPLNQTGNAPATNPGYGYDPLQYPS